MSCALITLFGSHKQELKVSFEETDDDNVEQGNGNVIERRRNGHTLVALSANVEEVWCVGFIHGIKSGRCRFTSEVVVVSLRLSLC